MSGPTVTSRVVSTRPDGTVVIETTISPAATPTPPPTPPPAPSGLPWLGADHDVAPVVGAVQGQILICRSTPS